MFIIHNATIIDNRERFRGYVVVENEFITVVEHGDLPAEYTVKGYEIIDAGGKLLIPGAIDTHVHFRDGGTGSAKGDIETESLAAVTGGVTTFFDMPNTVPPTVNIESWEKKMERAAELSYANYAFFLGATNNNLPILLRADYTKIPGVKLFMGSSTGNMLVDDSSTIRQLFEKLQCVIAVHAEDQNIINENTTRLREEFNGEIPVEKHPCLRSREACVSSSSTAIKLAAETGAKLHVLHISTADELTGEQHQGITRETCPHYLLFGGTDDYRRLGTRVKCNPAIKETTDRDSLLKAVTDNGSIDVIATDHAPHLPADKEGNALTAASGMPGVQFSLPLMLTLADDGKLSHERVVELMCNNPARLYNIDRRGFIRKGYYADMVLIEQCDHTITDADVVSRCGWTPYAGMKITRKVADVWVNGKKAPQHGAALPVKFNVG